MNLSSNKSLFIIIFQFLIEEILLLEINLNKSMNKSEKFSFFSGLNNFFDKNNFTTIMNEIFDQALDSDCQDIHSFLEKHPNRKDYSFSEMICCVTNIPNAIEDVINSDPIYDNLLSQKLTSINDFTEKFLQNRSYITITDLIEDECYSATTSSCSKNHDLEKIDKILAFIRESITASIVEIDNLIVASFEIINQIIKKINSVALINSSPDVSIFASNVREFNLLGKKIYGDVIQYKDYMERKTQIISTYKEKI